MKSEIFSAISIIAISLVLIAGVFFSGAYFEYKTNKPKFSCDVVTKLGKLPIGD